MYERLERNEPSAWETARTGQVVPPTERGLEEDGPTDIREILAMLEQERDKAEEEGCEYGEESDGVMDSEESDSAAEMIHEISSSGMFALDARPDVADTEKLQYVCDALGQDRIRVSGRTVGSSWSAQV